MGVNSNKGIIEFLQFMRTHYQHFLIYTVLMVFILTLFESAQQYYYIKQFDLAPNSDFTFFNLITNHGYRWIVWLIISLSYFSYIIFHGQINASFEDFKISKLLQQLVLVIVLNISIIAFIQSLINPDQLSMGTYLDNWIFFLFQKTPIYTLAHGSMLGLFYLVNSNQQLSIENLKLQNQLSEEQTQALAIKIGTKEKIIPLSDILWIEAYDYCVKIHTTTKHSYAMRNSLKALEKRLKSQQFLRVHRQAIVNMEMVKEVQYNSTSFLTLKNDTKIDISQSRIKEVRSFYN